MNLHAFPNFLCVSVEHCEPHFPHMLTPRAMQWDESTWILDLTSCRAYWTRRAQLLQLEPEMLLRKLMEAAGPYVGALAEHPWSALLLVAYMRERGMQGLMTSTSQFGQTAWTQITWDIWLAQLEKLLPFLTATQKKRFSAATVRRQAKLLRAAMRRLGQTRPQQLAEAQASTMERRFGATIAMVWEWSFPKSPTHSTYKAAFSSLPTASLPPPSSTYPSSFPWLSWAPPEKPSTTRHLDFPLWDWEPLAPLLLDDFDRLCRLPHWSAHERVLKITWQLRLDNAGRLDTLNIPIRFRHPHGLHAERGLQTTALAQAGFAFQNAQKELAQDLEFPPPILGWRLTIEERIIIPLQLTQLFPNTAEGERNGELLTLENQLPVPLYRFDLCADWLPEDSFLLRPESVPQEAQEQLPWLRLAAHRPMFLYRTPEPIPPPLTRPRFLERTSVKWWNDPAAATLHRDYYRYDANHKGQWIFQDQTGQWFLHGLFA